MGLHEIVTSWAVPGMTRPFLLHRIEKKGVAGGWMCMRSGSPDTLTSRTVMSIRSPLAMPAKCRTAGSACKPCVLAAHARVPVGRLEERVPERSSLLVRELRGELDRVRERHRACGTHNSNSGGVR